MFDYNVFAVLTPYKENHRATVAFELPHNAKRFRGVNSSVFEDANIDSREPTPVQSTTEDEAACIILTLDEEVKDPENMWQFGTRPSTSDVLLGRQGIELISAKQCNLTIDDNEHCIWLHDYHSSVGTAIGYDEQMKDEVRRKETWILSHGPGSEKKGLGEITIHIGKLSYKIEFPNHEAAHPEYIKNLRAFIKKCKDAAPPFEGLGLDSDPPTQKPSQAHTPSTRPLYLPKEVVGKGAFGEVRRVIKLRDGKSYAAKYFIPPKLKGHKKSDRKRKQDEINEIGEAYKVWLERVRGEFTIMQNNPHPNVVRVIDFIDTPEPTLIMEWYPLGNIQDVGVLYDQYVTVFAQILSGLSHLHKNGVAHRDLKPENFLVKKEPLTVAIADFGLSKVKDDDTLFKTFCGTLKNLAPEAFPGCSDSDGYGLEVDIWSAGVIMLEWIYNVPKPQAIPTPRRRGQEVTEGQWRQWVAKWVELLLKKLDDQEDDLVVKILHKMIEPDFEKRWSADQCLEYGLQSGLFKIATDGRLVGIDDPDENDDEDNGDDGTKTPTTRSPRTQAMNIGGSDVQRSKRRDPDRSVDSTDVFGTDWLRDPNCVGSDVAALGDDVDEEDSRLSNWTSFHSKDSILASAYNVLNEQNNDQGSPLEGIEEPSMLEDCQPLYQSGIEWGHAGRSSGEPTDRPTRTVQPDSEAMAVDSSGVIHSHNEDGKVQPHDIHQSIGAVQEIRFRAASSLICASDLIKASSKRRWPASLILGPYETPVRNKNEAFVSYPDGLDLASRLKLPTQRLRDAKNEKVSWIPIEISKDEAAAIDNEAALIVHIWPSRSLINATNMLAVRGCRRTQLPNLLANSGIHVIHYRAYGMQGTYISYDDGLWLANALGYSEQRLGQIRNAMREAG